MPGVSTRGESQYLASEEHRAYHGRMYKPTSSVTGAILCHALTGTPDQWFGTGYYSEGWLKKWARYGFPVAMMDADPLWGNSTARTRLTALITYAQASLGFAAGPVHLFGWSMGSHLALRYAMSNPSKVATITLGMTIADIEDIYDNNRNGLASSVSTAYGGDPGPSNNPAANPSAFDGIPINMYYSTNDTVGQPADTIAFAAAVDEGYATSLGAVGHTAIFMDNDAPPAFATDRTVLPVDPDLVDD